MRSGLHDRLEATRGTWVGRRQSQQAADLRTRAMIAGMVRRLVVQLVALVALIAACWSAPAARPTPTALPPCTMADGRPVVDVLRQYGREWGDTIKLADTVARIQLATPVGQLQRIRHDVQAQEWAACGQHGQRLLVEAMDAHTQGFLSGGGSRALPGRLRASASVDLRLV